MPLTQAQAIIETRARIDEEDNTVGFVTDAQIRGWLNEGVREVARRALWKRTSSNVSVTAGTQYYTAPATAIQIYRVEYSATGSSQKYTLEYGDISAMDAVWGDSQAVGRGIPDSYTLVSANPLSIQLYPTPAQNGTIKVYYYSMPADLATSSTADAATNLDTPIGWEDLVVEWATALAHRKGRDLQAYQVSLAQFQSSMQRLIEMAVRYTDEPTHITPYYSGEYWW